MLSKSKKRIWICVSVALLSPFIILLANAFLVSDNLTFEKIVFPHIKEMHLIIRVLIASFYFLWIGFLALILLPASTWTRAISSIFYLIVFIPVMMFCSLMLGMIKNGIYP